MKTVFLSSRAASFELENDLAYYSAGPYSVQLNGKAVLSDVESNVFTLRDLMPSAEYEVEAAGEKTVIKTDIESVTLSVRDFNAKGDGASDDTGAIQTAILCCPPSGRVLIEKGTYLIRPVFLKSNISIELAEGAVLLGETDRNKYPILPGIVEGNGRDYYFGTWEGKAESAFASLITGMNVENVKIYGLGTVDGNADKSDWWENDIVRRIAWRPRGIFLNRCKNIAIEGITCRNTASWNQHPFFSSDISYINMKLENPKENPNTDGIDPDSCHRVSILGCRFSVGDDCIAIKSGKAEMGEKLKTPSTDITVRNCLMEFGHGAVTLGSEISAGLFDINVSKCFFRGTERGLRIKTQRGRGKRAVIDGVVFDNIVMEDVENPLVINMFYKARNDERDEVYKYNPGPVHVDDRTPHFGSFVFRNIHATGTKCTDGYFMGLPEMPIESVRIENSEFVSATDADETIPALTLHPVKLKLSGFHFTNVRNVEMKNVRVEGNIGNAFNFEGVENKTIE